MTWPVVLALFLGYMAGLFTCALFAMSSREDDRADDYRSSL